MVGFLLSKHIFQANSLLDSSHLLLSSGIKPTPLIFNEDKTEEQLHLLQYVQGVSLSSEYSFSNATKRLVQYGVLEEVRYECFLGGRGLTLQALAEEPKDPVLRTR